MALNDYEDALKSFIHDDDKLVTYKWLSKEFEIHVNLAKDILKQYWEKYRNKEKIVATLLLVGQLKDGSIRVVVVKESDLDSVKQKFVKIDCEHLYSIQKSLPDIELLALVGGTDLRYSAIKCNEEYIRNDDEIESLRYVGNVRKEENKSAKTSTTINKPSEKPIPKKVEVSPTEKLKKDSGKKVEVSPTEKSKKQGGKKNEVKEKEKLEEKDKADPEPTTQEKKTSPPNKPSNNNFKPNNKTSKKPIQSKQSGFNNLFGKVPNKPQTPPNKPADSQEDKKSSSQGKTEQHEKPSSKEKDTKLTKEKEKSNKVKDQEKEKRETREKENRHSQSEEKTKNVAKTEDKTDKSKSKAKTDTRGKKRNRSQEKNTLSKRKRIVVLDSSEDECEKSDNDEEELMIVEEIPPKVVLERSPSPPAEKRENGKRKVKKTIDKNYKDADGYLVTKREHVYESCSDNEEVKEVPQKPKTVEPQAKKKQTTLMSFFKKP